MDQKKLTVGILLGSYREDCAGKRVAAYIQKQLLHAGVIPHIINADVLGVPMLTKTYAEYAKEGTIPPVLAELHALYQTLDAFVLVSGEYNHAPQPGLLNLLNFFYREYWFKTSGIVSYSVGTQGGLRAVSTLRAFTSALGMPSIQTVISVGDVRQTLTGGGVDTKETLKKTTDRFVQELLWYAWALRTARAQGVPF